MQGFIGAQGNIGGLVNKNGVRFDGSNDYLRHTTGCTDSKTFLMSFWIEPDGSGTNTILDIGDGSGSRLSITFSGASVSTQEMTIVGTNSSGTVILTMNSGGNYLTNGDYNHVMIAVDMTNSAASYIYFDDTDVTTIGGTFTNDTLEMSGGSSPRVTVGGNTQNPPTASSLLNGDLAEFYFLSNDYLDISNSANRAKFRSSNRPTNIGADGSLPTGTAAEIYLTGDTSVWHTNSGSIGGFTESGALADGLIPVEIP